MKLKMLVMTIISIIFSLVLYKQIGFANSYAATTTNGPVTISFSGPLSITCILGDINCRFSQVAIIYNRLSIPIYDTTIYTSSQQNSLTYTNPNGAQTSGTTVIPGRREPGAEIYNTLVQMKPLPYIGQQIGTLLVDAKTCNLNTNPPDCYYYGATTAEILINVVPASSPVPSIFPTPTPVPSLMPTPTPMPTIIPTPTPVPTVIPTPTPTPVPTVQPTPTPTPSPTITPISYFLVSGNIKFGFWFWGKPVVNTKVVVYQDKSIIGVTSTDEKGNYVFNLPKGKYVIQPMSIAGFTIIPNKATVTVRNRNMTGINFLAIPRKFKLW